MNRGAFDFLTKPIDFVDFEITLRKTLQQVRRLRQAAADRDKLVALEQDLRTAATIQQSFLPPVPPAGIAHEIRNPLNFVTNFAQLAADQLAELRDALAGEADRPAGELLAELGQSLAKIEEHGRRADRIVQAMLLHARGQRGHRQRTDLNALVAEHARLAYHGLRGLDPGVQVTLETDLDPSLEPVEVYPQELSRVVLNLTQNACQAALDRARSAGPGFVPRVRVSTRALEGEVELRFRDNGLGLAPGVRDRVFEPFFTTRPAGTGTGLGLSISYDIVVQMHQGRLWAESEEGQYAQFVVALPRESRSGFPA
jgi:signal transduction histidine kinase